VIAFLKPFEGSFTLKWLDESNAVCVFKNAVIAQKAFQLLSGGPFSVKYYRDNDTPEPNPKTKRFLILKDNTVEEPLDEDWKVARKSKPSANRSENIYE